MRRKGTSENAGGRQARHPLLPNGRRLAGLALLPLVFVQCGARADEAGKALVRRVLEQVVAMQPAVCDYTVTYQLGKASLTQKYHAYISGNGSGRRSTQTMQQGDLPRDLGNLLFNTVDFLPRRDDPFTPAEKPLDSLDARYLGRETVEGATYEVAEVTMPIRRFVGDPPARRVTLRWYVGADNLIHRITTVLPPSDAGGAASDQALVLAERAKIHAPPSPPSKPPGAGAAKSPAPALGKQSASGKLPASGSVKVPAAVSDKAPAPDGAMILVEALSEGARKAVTPPARPLSNPPLPVRVRWEADGFRRVLALAPDGRLLAVSTRENAAACYDTTTGEKTLTLAGQGVPITHLVFAGDGRMVAGADEMGNILLWDAGSGQQRAAGKADANIRGLALSLDGARLAVFSGAVTVDIWDTAKDDKLCSLSAPNMQTVSLSPDGARLVTTGTTEMALWDSVSGKQRFRIPYVSGPFPILPAAWSPDGKFYVWMRSDGSVAVCDGQTGALVRELKGMAGVLSALTFGGDGKTLLAVDADQRGDIPTSKPGLIIWNTTSWNLEEARELAGTRTNGVQSPPLFAPAGRRLLLIDSEGVQFWDLAESLPPITASP